MSQRGVEVVRPVSPAAVCAAVAFAAGLPGFPVVEAALRRLAARDADWSLESLIVKVSALDSLYATNLYGAVRMAQWIGEHVVPPAQWTTGTVETIAALPEEGTGRPARRRLSFASKFAHFFVDSSRFPLYDQYAYRRLLYHVRSPELHWETTPAYRAFVDAVEVMRAGRERSFSLADLDCYLWLSGQWMVLRRGGGAADAVGKEVRGALRADSHLRRELDRHLKED